jgi:hypothetical protein
MTSNCGRSLSRAHGLFEPLPHARLAAPVAGAVDFDHAIVGEHVSHIVPHLAVDVIAKRGLEIAHRILVVEVVDPR